jgi:tetratricopeptide (TPR) repeat protein
LYLVVFAATTAALVACGPQAARRGRRMQAGADQDEAYLRGVAATLNDLAAHVDPTLLPAQPILTASTSSDGKEVLATCTQNPKTPDGQINYLRVVTGNANFVSLDVQPGDIVRYYVNVDEEVAERGIEQRKMIELRVRRLDAVDPQNALIIEGSLTAPALVPQRLEVWRFSDKRTDAIRSALNRYVRLRTPVEGWEPSPDLAALRQIVEHANQWLRNQPPSKDNWRRDPLLDELPAKLRKSAGVADAISAKNLADGVFADSEGRLLQQAVWCRDIGQWAGGNTVTDSQPKVAAALFDWTVRNVQLDRGDGAATILHPWQALAYGHGSAAHRAWVFVELCRQQGIDAVVLRAKDKGGKPALLLVGVLSGGEVLLFDPQLGLPVPGGAGVAATLAEATAKPELLRALDVKDKFVYPLDAEQLSSLEALVVASPLQLARRSAKLEGGLEGEEFVKLSVDSRDLAERLKKLPQVKRVALWTLPFESLAEEQTIDIKIRRRAAAEFAPFAERPLLWKARVLHIQGDKELRAEERDDPLADPRRGHQDALKLYQDPSVRPPKNLLAKLEPAKQEVYREAKAEASYWLGLLSYDRGNFETAEQWLGERTLEHLPEGRWADGARYNLARAHEAQGQLGRAIELLESDPPEAPQRHGNLVRAEQLRHKAEATKAEPADAKGAGAESK